MSFELDPTLTTTVSKREIGRQVHHRQTMMYANVTSPQGKGSAKWSDVT